jgi:addiction module HigA family antidote
MTKTHFSHPGGILKRMFLDEYGLKVGTAASAMGVPRDRLGEIVRGKRSISAETALHLGKFFGNGPEFWLNLQTHYDLALAEIKERPKLKKVKSVAELLGAPA